MSFQVVSNLNVDVFAGPIIFVDMWIPFDQALYYFSSTRGTWNESQTSCASMNSNLVVITSLRELVRVLCSLHSVLTKKGDEDGAVDAVNVYFSNVFYSMV